MLLQPSNSSTMFDLILRTKHDNCSDTGPRYSNHHDPPKHSIILHQQVQSSNQSDMKMLPCQQVILPGGNNATIIGCFTQNDTWIEFRFWRIWYDRWDTKCTGHSSTTSTTPMPEHATDITVEKYGFCRIQNALYLPDNSATFTYSECCFSSVNNIPQRHRRQNGSSESKRPRLYMIATQGSNYFVHEFRILPWVDNDNINEVQIGRAHV